MLNLFVIMLRLGLAFILGGLIGFEREIRHHSAGLRTHILVCLGSCLIMLTSLYVFDIYRDIAPLDPARIAAGVVTGIGFLGAGTIIRSGEAVKGLTTAATLWFVAGVGLGVGCGFYAGSLIASFMAVAVLYILRYLECNLIKKEQAK